MKTVTPVQLTEAQQTAKIEATKYHDMVLEGIKVQSTGFLQACRAMFHINATRMYKTLGFDTWRAYAESKAIGLGFSTSKGYVRVGRMLAFGDAKYLGDYNDKEEYKQGPAESTKGWGIRVTDAEFIKTGYASMLEISRLADTPENFDKNIEDICDYITARAKGDYTYAKLKAEIDAMLKPKAKPTPEPTGDDTGDGEGDGEVESTESTEPAWKTELKRLLGTAESLESFLADASALQGTPMARTAKTQAASASVQ